MSSLLDPDRVNRAGRAPGATSSPYVDLLETAYEMGAADGELAARLALPEDPGALGARCRGRHPDEFARWLWGERPGPAPAGLVNAGPWYLQGFRDGLAAGWADSGRSELIIESLPQTRADPPAGATTSR